MILQCMEMVCAHIYIAVRSSESYSAHLQAEEALAASEMPVGCVFARGGKAIARARNRTNELRNVFLRIPAEVTR